MKVYAVIEYRRDNGLPPHINTIFSSYEKAETWILEIFNAKREVTKWHEVCYYTAHHKYEIEEHNMDPEV